MDRTEDHTDQLLTDDQSPTALESQSDSANGSLEGDSDHSNSETRASPPCGGISDGHAQPGPYQQPPTHQTQATGFIPFSLDGDSVNNAEQCASLRVPVAGSLECIASQTPDKGLEDDPAHLEEFKMFVERVKRKLLQSLEVFQQHYPQLQVEGTGGFPAQDDTHGSRSDLLALTSAVIAVSPRQATSAGESAPATDTPSLAARVALKEFSTPLHSTPSRPPTSSFRLTSTPVVSSPVVSSPVVSSPVVSSPVVSSPVVSSPVVSSLVVSSPVVPGLVETVRMSGQEYEKLLDETLCVVEKVLWQQMQKESPKLATKACCHGPSATNRVEETEEVMSLRSNEKKLKQKIHVLEDHLNMNGRLMEMTRISLSNKTEEVEMLRKQIVSLKDELLVKKNELYKSETDLSHEREEIERCRRELTKLQDDFQQTRNSYYDYIDTCTVHSNDLREQSITLKDNIELISRLRSDLDTTTLHLKNAEDELQKEKQSHSTLQMKMKEMTELLKDILNVFNNFSSCLLTFEENPDCDEKVRRKAALPLVYIEGVSLQSFHETANYILHLLQNNLKKLRTSRMDLERLHIIKSNESESCTELEETVKEVKRQRDAQKERLKSLTESILEAISITKKLYSQRKEEMKLLNDFLKGVNIDQIDCDTPNDDPRTASDLYSQNFCARTKFREFLEELLKKMSSIECVVGSPTADESVGANSSALMDSSSFREEQESIIEEHSLLAQVGDAVSLQALDNTLSRTLKKIDQLKLSKIAQRSADTKEKRDALRISREHLLETMQNNERLCDGRCEALEESLNKSEGELKVLKQHLKNLSSQIISVVDESSKTIENSRAFDGVELRKHAQTCESYVKIYAGPLRLVCRDALNIDDQGTLQLLNLLRCCSIAVTEYELNFKEPSSPRKENVVSIEEAKKETRCNQKELDEYRGRMEQLSNSFVKLSENTVSCTDKLRAFSLERMTAGSPLRLRTIKGERFSLDSSTATPLQTSPISCNIEYNFMRLSNSVESLITIVEKSIEDICAMNNYNKLLEKDMAGLKEKLFSNRSEVLELKDQRRKERQQTLVEHEAVVRELNKRLEDKTTRVEELEEKLERCQHLIIREKSILRGGLANLDAMEAGTTEIGNLLRRASETSRGNGMGSHDGSDSGLADQDRSTGSNQREDPDGENPDKGTGANQREDSTVVAARDSPPTREIAAAQDGAVGHRAGEALQLEAVPDASMLHLTSTPKPCRGELLQGPPRVSSRHRVGRPRPRGPCITRDDDEGSRSRPASRTVLPHSDYWVPRFVLCCVSIAVVWYLYTKRAEK